MNGATMRSLLTIAVVGTTLIAPAAFARIGGHAGATGRPNGGVCNQCHSAQTYDGARISFDAETRVRERQCFARDGEGKLFLENTIHTIPYGAQGLRVDLIVDEPPAGDDETVGLFCPEGSTCGEPVAGFGIEVVGFNVGRDDAPVLAPAGTQADMKQANAGGIESKTEVNHSAPRAFAAGKVSWPFVLHSQSRAINSPTSVTLYAAANACNANGEADPGDITSVATPVTLYFEYGEDTGMHTGPECNEDLSCEAIGATLGADGLCACAEGAELDDTGRCPTGCSHVAVQGGPVTGAVFALFLLGFALLRRRR